jgi:virginiamycin B lyase
MRRALRTAGRTATAALIAGTQLWLAPVWDPGLRAQETVEILEWDVPWESSRPRDPFVDEEGTVWFVGQRSDYVGRLDRASGEFRRYDLDRGAGPHNLIVGTEGVWYAGNRAAHVGLLNPATGDITRYPMPDRDAGDPHTLVFDSRGNIWFTVQHGNFVGRLRRQSGEVDLVRVPTATSRPYGIVVDESDRPWFTEFAGGKIGTIDPETLELTEIDLPRPESRPRRLSITSDGRVWYVDFGGGYLGAIEPQTLEIREWPAPAGRESRPYGMVVDDRDRLWFVETGQSPNRLAGFDPATEEFFSLTEIPSGAGSVRHMYFHAPDREIWFGTDANTIGRARLGGE